MTNDKRQVVRVIDTKPTDKNLMNKQHGGHLFTVTISAFEKMSGGSPGRYKLVDAKGYQTNVPQIDLSKNLEGLKTESDVTAMLKTDNVKTTVDFNVVRAKELLNTLENVEQLDRMIEGEIRAGVLSEYKKLLDKFKKG